MEKLLRLLEALVTLAIISLSIVTALFIATALSPAQAAELRVQHTSRMTLRGVTTNIQQVLDCKQARRAILKRTTARQLRFWCDGKEM